jgi:hypothetical protein
MAENHALVFWNVGLNQLAGAVQPGGVQVLNVDPDDVPGLSAYFNAGWRVVSHQVSNFNGPQGESLLVSLYLQRVFDVPAAPPAP